LSPIHSKTTLLSAQTVGLDVFGTFFPAASSAPPIAPITPRGLYQLMMKVKMFFRYVRGA
jgi:hypothetical protein